jgi:hypothetical protein
VHARLPSRRHSKTARSSSLAPFALAATLTPGELQANAAVGDPTEDKGIACAVEGRAGYGIAGDIHLLKLERCARIVILPPRRFPDVLEELKQSGG